MSNKEKKNQNEINMEELEQASGGLVQEREIVTKKGFLGLGRKTKKVFDVTENVTGTVVGTYDSATEASNMDFKVNKQIN